MNLRVPSWEGVRFRILAAKGQPGRWVRSRNSGVHQLSHATESNRYPELFDTVCALVPADAAVLSFGCSTGEEVEALAKRLPEARLVGADVTESVLGKARLRCKALPNATFVNSLEQDVANFGPFDAVFAMSVLCRHPESMDVATIAEMYPFERFEATCDDLAGLIRDGGYLVIYNANYRFTDTATSKAFTVAASRSEGSGFVVKFDPDGMRSTEQTFAPCVFQKQPSVEAKRST